MAYSDNLVMRLGVERQIVGDEPALHVRCHVADVFSYSLRYPAGHNPDNFSYRYGQGATLDHTATIADMPFANHQFPPVVRLGASQIKVVNPVERSDIQGAARILVEAQQAEFTFVGTPAVRGCLASLQSGDGVAEPTVATHLFRLAGNVRDYADEDLIPMYNRSYSAKSISTVEDFDRRVAESRSRRVNLRPESLRPIDDY